MQPEVNGEISSVILKHFLSGSFIDHDDLTLSILRRINLYLLNDVCALKNLIFKEKVSFTLVLCDSSITFHSFLNMLCSGVRYTV